VTCYMRDPSYRQGMGRSPTTNKTATVLVLTKIWSWVPEGAQHHDGPTER